MGVRRRGTAIPLSAGLVAWLVVMAPLPATAHALGGVFTLPVPLGLYLSAAGAAVAASFAVAVLVVRPVGPVASYPAAQS